MITNIEEVKLTHNIDFENEVVAAATKIAYNRKHSCIIGANLKKFWMIIPLINTSKINTVVPDVGEGIQQRGSLGASSSDSDHSGDVDDPVSSFGR